MFLKQFEEELEGQSKLIVAYVIADSVSFIGWKLRANVPKRLSQ